MKRWGVDDGATLIWRGALHGEEINDLTRSYGREPTHGWWDEVWPHSLGWVTARHPGGLLVGFVNVAWDGSHHAFLLDTKTHIEWQHRGLATRIVRLAAKEAHDAGCTWLHVDFEPHLEDFYLDACGFASTTAGLLDLTRGKAAP